MYVYMCTTLVYVYTYIHLYVRVYICTTLVYVYTYIQLYTCINLISVADGLKLCLA